MSHSEPAATETPFARFKGAELDTSGLLLITDYPSFHARLTPDRNAVTFLDWRWTYSGLDRACNAAVTLLQRFGIGRGDRVAYIGRNSDLYFIVMIAVMRAGAVLVPVNWRNTAAETAFVLDDSTTRLIFSDTEFMPVVEAADTKSRHRVVTDDDGERGLRARLAVAAPAAPQPVDPFVASLQLYTSGTTGKPKGVLTSQHAFAVQRHLEKQIPAFGDWRDDEILLSPLPNFHIGGASWVMTALARGLPVVITADLAPSSLLRQCLAHGITRTFLVPTLVRALIEEIDARGVCVPTLRAIHYGAASMDAALLERSVDRIGCRFLQYYGMTEVTGSITLLDPKDHDLARPRLLRSVGRPLPGHTIEIRGPGNQLLQVNQPGEIWVRGPSLLIGYWNQPEATAEALQDGWYRSGDGGMMDEDGYLFLTDRIKDMIVSGGENVYPAEVETVLREHPAVLDCAVFALPHPKWGEGVTAAIELRPNAKTDAESLIAFARKSLAAYKVPRRIEIGVTLPRTASGKVQRGLIRKTYLTQPENTA